jgi:hypothetical protein
MKRTKRTTRSLPSTPDAWLAEIKLAIADAQEAKPFGVLTGRKITDAELFHLAPLVAALDLLDERQGDAILTYFEGHSKELEAGA